MLIPAPDDTMADAIGKAARAFEGPLTFLEHLSDDDVYGRGLMPGGVLIVIPGLWTTMPDELLAAVRSRRRASATGRCPSCDAVLELATGEMQHSGRCAVADDRLRPLLTAWARRVGIYARGRRIVEDPA